VTGFRQVLRIVSALAMAVVLPLSSQAGEQSRPDLEGVWMTTYLSLNDSRWRIEDLACSGWCSTPAYKYLQDLLRDPANDARPVKELVEDMQQFNQEYLDGLLTPLGKARQAEYDPAKDPAVDCDPEGDGWRHQLTAPPPIEIEQHDDRVVIRYEYWNAVRTVYMDGRGHPEDVIPSRLGHSIGWYEGSTLVVETAALKPSLVSLPGGYLLHSPDALGMERYTISDEGERLDLEWSIVDPVHFREPYRGQKSMLSAPGWQLEEFVCEAITGEF